MQGNSIKNWEGRIGGDGREGWDAGEVQERRSKVSHPFLGQTTIRQYVKYKKLTKCGHVLTSCS